MVGKHNDGILKVGQKQNAKDSMQSVNLSESKSEIKRESSPQIASKSPMFVGKRVVDDKPPLTFFEVR